MRRIKKLTLSLAILILVRLALPLKPIISHSGHDHSPSSEQKPSPTQQQEINSTPKHQSDTLDKPKIKVVMTEKTTPLAIIPQKSEWIFILIIITPFILKVMRKKIHHNTQLD